MTNRMKKVVLLMIGIVSLTVYSCKQKEVVGPAGPAGTNGTNGTNGKDGKDGNANVKTYNFIVGESDWKSGRVWGGYEDSVGWYATIKNINILTKSIIDSGSYYLVYTADQTIGKEWATIPTIRLQSIPDGSNTKTLPLQISFAVDDYSPNELEIRINSTDLKKIANPSSLLYNEKKYFFRLVVIEGI